MSSTITAMFDTRSDAEAAKERLKAASFDTDNVHVHDRSSDGYCEQDSTHQDRGMWESIKHAFLPDEDRHTYEEGVRRGGAVLTADVDDDKVAEAMQVLEDAGSVDVDERAGQWRQSGWNHPAARTAEAPAFAGLTGSGDDNDALANRAVADRAVGQEEVIPIVEEVVVSRSAGERVEQIDGTVRRTEVEIDRDGEIGASDPTADRR